MIFKIILSICIGILFLIGYLINIKTTFLILAIFLFIKSIIIILFYDKLQRFVCIFIKNPLFIYLDKLSYSLVSLGMSAFCIYKYLIIDPSEKFNIISCIILALAYILAIIVTKLVDRTHWNNGIKILIKLISYCLLSYGIFISSLLYAIFITRP